ncbi:protein CMSS1 isoform X2 [Microcaecilia unicolor]|uniref:Protein CMSS1 isoform X2 n=1 Tax=Microcaecilia unicolor TaxID=1415580 RepID=A0A6P7YAN9_9AMPH|nr:protein CMSS1 isoform X2 [Microcaecilia unicolor]
MSPSSKEETAEVESSENEDMIKESSARKRKQQDSSEKSTKQKSKGQSNRRPSSVEKKNQPSKGFLTPPEGEKENTKKKRKRKKKKISEILAQSDPKPGVPSDLQRMLVQHFENKRTVIEMEELMLPDACFLPSNDLTHTLSSYLKEICPKWTKLCKNHQAKKSPLLLLVCSSAHRALELIKLLTAFNGNSKVLKLFAKHIKIKEQMKSLEKGVIHLGVGTPARIKALIEQDGLTLDSLKCLIFDWNWRDQKLRRMMEIPEVKKETMELLKTGMIAACRAGTLKLGLF